MDGTSHPSIKEVFDEECSGLVISPKLIKTLLVYEQNFINKNDDHIAFFGSNLLGVNPVRFHDVDRDRWFNEIMNVDEVYLTDRLHDLPTVNTDWLVSSDSMNLSCVWVCHKLLNDKHLTEQQKEAGMIAVMQMLQYKFFTSRYGRHFPHEAPKSLAEAVHATLSGKFLIKKFGNWHALFTYRAKEIIDKHGIHYNTIKNMDVDKDIIDMVNDIQGRIRDMLKNMYGEFLRVRDAGNRISTTTLTIEHDGEEMLKDKKKSSLEYYRYLTNVITDRNSFIRVELVQVIAKMMDSMPPYLFQDVLEWMSNNYRQQGAGVIDEVVNETLIHSIDYLSKHRQALHTKSDLPALLTTLRGGYMSSRSTDASLMQLREKTEKLVRMAIASKNASVIASLRTGVLLYLVLRAYTMHYYTS